MAAPFGAAFFCLTEDEKLVNHGGGINFMDYFRGRVKEGEMFRTAFGVFNGGTWEHLCQKVFKMKYGEENYQEMVSSPGDFGIEGFIKNRGVAFQCYCPEKEYSQKELREKQRDKINADLKKLKCYEAQLKSRLGGSKISQWVFVTPVIEHNQLLEYAAEKTQEVRDWGLEILGEDFHVILKDADFYAQEIAQVNGVAGDKRYFLEPPKASVHYKVEEYEGNVFRKNKIRCEFDGVLNESKHQRTNERTIRKWLAGESLLKTIEKNGPELHFRILRVINQYEEEVAEISDMWRGDAEDLVEKVRSQLALRIAEAVSELGEAERHKLADSMTSKWIALCPLEIE